MENCSLELICRVYDKAAVKVFLSLVGKLLFEFEITCPLLLNTSTLPLAVVIIVVPDWDIGGGGTNSAGNIMVTLSR